MMAISGEHASSNFYFLSYIKDYSNNYFTTQTKEKSFFLARDKRFSWFIVVGAGVFNELVVKSDLVP